MGIEVGAWVKLEGVNTNPSESGEKIHLIFNFFDSDGINLLSGPLTLTVPQTEASTGWVEVKSMELLSFTGARDSITFKFHAADKVTGTVWVDDIFLRKTDPEAEWPGNLFNPNVDMPEGWFYWWPGESTGDAAWDTLVPVFAGQTRDEAHTGNASLKLVKDYMGDEVTVNSDIRDFINNGRALEFSAWVMTELPVGTAELANLVPPNGIGFTVTWHDGTGGAGGWGEVDNDDFQFTLAGDTTEWTEYSFAVTPPVNAIQFSLRARYWPNFVGTTYWDDFKVVEIDTGLAVDLSRWSTVPKAFKLDNPYPNPFNPTTTIRFEVPYRGLVNIRIYDLLGRQIARLMDVRLDTGSYEVLWNPAVDTGVPLSSGIYLVRVQFDRGEAQVQKVTYLK